MILVVGAYEEKQDWRQRLKIKDVEKDIINDDIKRDSASFHQKIRGQSSVGEIEFIRNA